MTLDPAFRKAVEIWTDQVFVPLIERYEMDKRTQQASKYEHEFDFYLGYFLGLFEGQNIQLFKQMHGVEISDPDRFELEEILDLRLKKIKEILKKKTKS